VGAWENKLNVWFGGVIVIGGYAGNSTDVTLLGIIQPCDTSYNMNYE